MFFVNQEIANGVDKLFTEDAEKFGARFSALDENGLPTWISLFGESHYEDVNADL